VFVPLERLLLALFAAWFCVACDSGRQLHRPVPEEFRAFTLTDEVLDRSSLDGRPWVITVWRPGCAPCMRQLGALDRLKRRWASKGVGFVALSLETDEAKIFEAAAKAEVDSTLAYGDAMMAALGLMEVPSTVFLDRRLTIVASLTGEADDRALEKWLLVAVP
jgi:hypothetical protein